MGHRQGSIMKATMNKEEYAEFVVAVDEIKAKANININHSVTYDGDNFIRTVVWEFPNYQKAVECHGSKEYQDGWAVAKGTTLRHMQIVEGFSIE